MITLLIGVIPSIAIKRKLSLVPVITDLSLYTEPGEDGSLVALPGTRLSFLLIEMLGITPISKVIMQGIRYPQS